MVLVDAICLTQQGVCTDVKKHYDSQCPGYLKQDLDPYYMIMILKTLSNLKKRVIIHTFHTRYLLTKGLLFPVILLFQYFKFLFY